MKLNNRFIFGLLSIFLAAIIAFVAIPTVSRRTNGKTEIVRITNPILKGAVITENDIEAVEIGSYNLPANIARSREDVVGFYATADLAAGDYILSSKISMIPVTSDVALNEIPSGKVAISLTVKTLASGLSDKLQPGDIIRIYHFLESAQEIPELNFVKVLAVTAEDGINVDNTKELTIEEEKQQSATITVLASTEQARIITGLENDGMAHVALIARNNEKLAAELLSQQEEIITEIYYPELLTPEDGGEMGDDEDNNDNNVGGNDNSQNNDSQENDSDNAESASGQTDENDSETSGDPADSNPQSTDTQNNA